MTTNTPKVDKKSPKDGNYEVSNHQRHVIQSGQATIHGRALFEVLTQEAQSFGFYSGTGQGGNVNGPGEGRSVLNTPGMSFEVLGEGLQVKGNDDRACLPAKYILCRHGDIILNAEDGDILLMGKNIRMFAQGGGDDGDFIVQANKVASIKSPDVRIQSDKLVMKANKDMNIVVDGYLELTYGFCLASSKSDLSFGAMSILQKALKITGLGI